MVAVLPEVVMVPAKTEAMVCGSAGTALPEKEIVGVTVSVQGTLKFQAFAPAADSVPLSGIAGVCAAMRDVTETVPSGSEMGKRNGAVQPGLMAQKDWYVKLFRFAAASSGPLATRFTLKSCSTLVCATGSMPSLKVPPGRMTGVPVEPVAAMVPEMLTRSFCVAVSEPQGEKMVARRLVRVRSVGILSGSFSPIMVPVKGALELKEYVSELALCVTVKAKALLVARADPGAAIALRMSEAAGRRAQMERMGCIGSPTRRGDAGCTHGESRGGPPPHWEIGSAIDRKRPQERYNTPGIRP